MGRFICMTCGRDLGYSPTPEDSHGVCDDCAAAMMGVTVAQWRERVARDMAERERAKSCRIVQ